MSERGINGCGGLVVAAMKRLRVDAQGGVGLAWPSRFEMVTMSHLAGSDKLTGVGVFSAWNVTSGWPMLSAKCAHAADAALGDSGPPSAAANSKASSATLPMPSRSAVQHVLAVLAQHADQRHRQGGFAARRRTKTSRPWRAVERPPTECKFRAGRNSDIRLRPAVEVLPRSRRPSGRRNIDWNIARTARSHRHAGAL